MINIVWYWEQTFFKFNETISLFYVHHCTHTITTKILALINLL